jgi:hypothetical protein
VLNSFSMSKIVPEGETARWSFWKIEELVPKKPDGPFSQVDEMQASKLSCGEYSEGKGHCCTRLLPESGVRA